VFNIFLLRFTAVVVVMIILETELRARVLYVACWSATTLTILN